MREDLSNFSDTWEEMDQRGDDWSFTYQNGKIRKLTQRQYAWAKGKNRQEISTPFQIEFQYNSGGLSSEISYLEEQTPVSPYLCVDSLISFYNLGWNRNWDHDNYYHIFTAFEKLRLQEVMFCIYKSSSLSEILFWCEKQGHEIVRLMIDCDDTGKITTVTDYWERTIYEYDPKMNRLAKRIHRSKSFSSPNYLENDEKSMEIARDFSESYYYDSLGRIIKTSGQNIYSSRPNIRLEKSYARTGKIVDYKIKEH
jgi:hypothetical protein